MYRILHREADGRWTEVGNDDVAGCAWDWLWGWLPDGIDMADVGVLTDLHSLEEELEEKR